jgi:mannosyltransferase
LDCIIFGLQPFGGISNYWARLVAYASTNPTIACSLVVPKQLKYREIANSWSKGMPVHRERLDARIARYLSASTGKNGDVFHTSYYRLPRTRVNKYIVTVYDFTYERYGRGLARFVHTRQKLSSIRRADIVLCISESTRRDVLELCPDVDIGKLRVAHLGVDREAFYQDKTPSTATTEKVVLFLGKRVDYKRFDIAVDAVRQSPDLSLGVVGPTLSQNEREMLTQQLGDRWQEYGPVDAVQLRRLYSSAYAFIFPSDYEGFGLPVLEAMACGCPVVAAAKSSLPEVGGAAAHYAGSQNGEAYASELRELSVTQVRKETILAGLSQAASFDWSHTFRQTLSAYTD